MHAAFHQRVARYKRAAIPTNDNKHLTIVTKQIFNMDVKGQITLKNLNRLLNEEQHRVK